MANFVTVESLLIDFEVRPYEKFGRQFLDCKSDGIRGFGKTPVAHWPVSLATARGKKLGRRGVVKACQCLLPPALWLSNSVAASFCCAFMGNPLSQLSWQAANFVAP